MGVTVRLQAVCALLGLALAGCVTTGQGEKMTADIGQLRQRLDVMEVRDRDINQKVGQLRTILDEATALLGRNSADLGARVAKNETDIAAMTGKIEEAKYLVGELQKQITTKVAAIEQSQGQLLQNQQRIVDRVAPTMPEDKEALWKEAQKRLADGQRDDARRFLRSFIQRFPDDPRAPQGQLQVGISFVQELKHRGFPNLPAHWLRRAKRSGCAGQSKARLRLRDHGNSEPGRVSSALGTSSHPATPALRAASPNPRPLPATLHPARCARPRALWRAPDEEGLKFLGLLVDGRADRWTHSLSEKSKNSSVESIGLGQASIGLGEVTHTFGIDGDSGQLGSEKGGKQAALKSAGSLKDDEGRHQACQLGA
jgi:hypothetical protein